MTKSDTNDLSFTPRQLQANDNEVVGGGGNDKNLSKKSKNAKSGIQTYIKAMEKPTFLKPGTKEAFNQLRQVFTKALMLRHFDSECHI